VSCLLTVTLHIVDVRLTCLTNITMVYITGLHRGKIWERGLIWNIFQKTKIWRDWWIMRACTTYCVTWQSAKPFDELDLRRIRIYMKSQTVRRRHCNKRWEMCRTWTS